MEKPSNEKTIYTEEQNIALSKTKNTKTPEQLATENYAFVFHLVDKEFSRYYRHVGIPREILVSAGTMGLVVAANRSKYGTFIRYASFWIRYYIYSEIRGYFFIKRQSSYCAKLNKLRKLQAKFENKHGRTPTYFELAQLSGMQKETIQDVIEFDDNNDTSTISLDALAEDPDTMHTIDAIMESESESIDIDSLDFKYLKELVELVLEGEEKQLVVSHFFKHADMSAIARELNCKKEHVKEVIVAAIERIKDHVAKERRYSKITGDYPVNSPVNMILKSRHAIS